MKKVNTRQFDRERAKLVQALKPGESLMVTKEGHHDFTVIKPTKARPRLTAAQCLKALEERATYPARIGDAILKRFADDSVF